MIYGEPPFVENLEEYREFMNERDIRVEQVYHPVVEVEGELVGGYWAIVVAKEGLLPDGRFWCRAHEMSNETLEMGMVEGWQLQADLLEREFESDVAEQSIR